MTKRSLSTTDSDISIADTLDSNGAPQKRQKRHHPSTVSLFMNRVASSVMGLFSTPSKSSESPSPPTPKLYPELPLPYSPPSPDRPGTSTEGETSQNPVYISDDDDESSETARLESSVNGWADYPAEAQQFPIPKRPSRRVRPQISSSDSLKRSYEWAEPVAPSTNPKIDRRKGAKQSRVLGLKRVRAAYRAATIPFRSSSNGRKHEEAYMSGEVKGREGRLRFEQIINANGNRTIDAGIKKEIKPFVPTKARVPEPPRNVELDKILDRLKLEAEASAKLVAARLKPSIPTSLLVEEEDLVDASLRNSKFSKSSVKIDSLLRLKPFVWLDDEIINHYGNMLQKRCKDDTSGTLPKIFYCNSFFHGKMKQGWNSQLGRWTKKFNIFELDKMIMAINVNSNHWTCAAINMKDKRVEYYDSMGDRGLARHETFKISMAYLAAEHQNKLGKPFDSSGWTLTFSRDDPQQDNGCDCGVFTCQTMENLARGNDLVKDDWEFDQSHMPFFRRMMVYEIATEKLYKRW